MPTLDHSPYSQKNAFFAAVQHRLSPLKNLFLACIACFVAACTSTPSPAIYGDRLISAQLLDAQIQTAKKQLEASKEPRLVYIGAALHDTSKAFRGDIDIAERRIKELDPQAVVLKLSNPPRMGTVDLPFALASNLQLIAKEVFPLLRSKDKVVVLLTSHGLPEILFTHAGGKNYQPITPRFLNTSFLNELKESPLMLLISACYSGSLIESLRSNDRIVMTASAKDRNSFGCQFDEKQTFFVNAVFAESWNPQKNMGQIFEDAKLAVDKREKSYKNLTPSQPQIAVGSKVKNWIDVPVRNWLKPLGGASASASPEKF